MGYSLLHTAEWIWFLCAAISTGYLFVFALSGCFRKSAEETGVEKQYRIAIVIKAPSPPAEWAPLLHPYLRQTYPVEWYELIIATSTPEEQLLPIVGQHATIIPVGEEISDGQLIRLAFTPLQEKKCDLLLIMDTCTFVSDDLLSQINTAYNTSSVTLQLHRLYAHRDPYPALWNAVGEEIKRTIASRGHNRYGLSASLEESGFVLEYDWLKENLDELPDDFTCRQLELYLLRDRQYIDFQDHIHLVSRKEMNSFEFHRKHRQSLSQQYKRFFLSLAYLPEGICSLNPDLLDRPLQWAILPPAWLLHLMGITALLTSWLEWSLSLKWWGLLLVLLFALALATPDYLVDKPFNKAMKRIPLYIPGWFLSFFSKPPS